MSIDTAVADTKVEVFERKFKLFKGKQLTHDELEAKTAADLAGLFILVDGRPIRVNVSTKPLFTSDGRLVEVYGSPCVVYGSGKVGRTDETPADKIPALDYLKEVADNSNIFIF